MPADRSYRSDAAYGCALHGEAFMHGCPGCLDYADDLAIVTEVRKREATDTGERITLEELAESVGINLDEVRDGTP